MKSFQEIMKESFLDEASTVGIQVADMADAVKSLKKAGVTAKPDNKLGDEVIVKVSDKKKVYKWMLKNGWDKEDIADIYSELV